jgi:hypothetical protein
MRKLFSLLFFLAGISASYAQDIEVEYDKNRDFTIYKTFALGEGEIITPKDQRKVSDEQLHKWVRDAISNELKDKGLVQLDSMADLKISYIVGSLERSDLSNNSAGGIGAGLVMNDFEQSSLVIDMNDRNNFLVWRISGVTSTGSPNAVSMIDEVVAKGFKKFSTKPKKKKK